MDENSTGTTNDGTSESSETTGTTSTESSQTSDTSGTAEQTITISDEQWEQLLENHDHLIMILQEANSHLWWFNTVLTPGFAMILFAWWFFSTFIRGR